MENIHDIPFLHSNPENTPSSFNLSPAKFETIIYPDKPELTDNKSKINVWVRSLSSLALYFVIGYFFFNKNWLLILLLTVVVIAHELGHFLAMKIYNYTDLGIFFIPLLGAYASGSKKEISQTQSAIIILAGPVPGIIAGVIIYYFSIYSDSLLLERFSWILIFLNLLNMLPIYPLDGGQLLNRLFLNESAIIGKIFIIISALALAWFFWNIHFYPLLLFPAMMIVRLFFDIKSDALLTKIEEEGGVELNTSYEDISNEQYWKLRHVLIKHHPDLIGIKQAPPYEYSDREDKVVSTIQSLLQRMIILDLTLVGKLIIVLIWMGCFATPFLIGVPLHLFF